MATQVAGTRGTRGGVVPAGWSEAVRGALRRSLGAVLVLLAVAVLVALICYDAADPSLNTASGRAPQNPIGLPGALVADALLALFGWAAVALLPALAVAGVRLAGGRAVPRWQAMALLTLAGAVVLAAAGLLCW